MNQTENASNYPHGRGGRLRGRRYRQAMLSETNTPRPAGMNGRVDDAAAPPGGTLDGRKEPLNVGPRFQRRRIKSLVLSADKGRLVSVCTPANLDLSASTSLNRIVHRTMPRRLDV